LVVVQRRVPGDFDWRIPLELCFSFFKGINILPIYNSVRKQINTTSNFASFFLFFAVIKNKRRMKTETEK